MLVTTHSADNLSSTSMKCANWLREYSKHTSDIETGPALLVLNQNTDAKQSEKIKSESIPDDALKYFGILASCFFFFFSFVVNFKMA